MSQSEAFIGFYTLLLGLGIATLLTRFADILRRRTLGAIGLVGWLLLLLIVFEFLSAWSGATRTFAQVQVNVASLLLPFLTGATYFLATVLLFPDQADADGDGLRRHIDRQTRSIALLLLLANAFLVGAELPSVSAKWAASPDYLWRFYLPWNAAILACYGVAAAVESRRVRAAVLAFLLLLYGWVTVTAQV